MMERVVYKVKYTCLQIDKTNLMLIYDKGVAIDISELNNEDISMIKNELNSVDDNNIFEREKIFSTKYYGNSLCIIPSNICQLKCKYCYSSSGEINDDRYINLHSIKKCIDSVFENRKLYKRIADFKLNFLFHGGGEPTENWNLFENIVEYILKKKNETGSKVFLKIVTNGIMSTDKANWIAKIFDEVVVSIDGPNCINDKIRVFENQVGSTDTAVTSANIFGKHSKLGIHSVVTSLSAGKSKEIIEFFKKNISNISFINFQRCRNTQDGRNEILSINIDEYLDFVQNALQYAPDLVRTSIFDITTKKAFCKGCSGNMLYCFPNGNVTLCNEHDNGVYKIGSYNDGITIDPSSYLNYKDSINLKIRELKCEQCFAFPFCRGGCQSYYLQCDNYNEEWCESLRTIVKQILNLRMNSLKMKSIQFGGKVLRYFYY